MRYITKAITNEELVKPFVWVVILCLSLLLCVYVYLVQNAVLNTVQIKRLSNDLSISTSKVNVLESEYFKVKDGVNLALASEMGFKAISKPKFITKRTLGEAPSSKTYQ
ncbi:MAG: hypothetical protein WCW87_02605 [Candidatus Paceibacterota bacterium]